MPIKVMKARQMYDSNGIPTLEVEVRNEKDTAIASVPCGVTARNKESVEVRDGEMRFWNGKGVLKAVENVNNYIGPLFIGKDIDETNQQLVDKILLEYDRTEDKSRMGANAIVGVSMAMARLGAMRDSLPLYAHISNLVGYERGNSYVLPVPLFTMLGGGVNYSTKLFMEEIMIMPTGTKNFEDAYRAGAEIYQQTKQLLASNYDLNAVNIGPLGQFCPHMTSEVEALELIKNAIEKAGYTGQVKVAINCNVKDWFKNDLYNINFKRSKTEQENWITGDELGDLYRNLLIKYSVMSLQDPFFQDDWKSWISLTEKTSVQIAGSSLLCSNPAFIQQAIEKQACNCLVLKLNEIGTVSEAIEAFKLARNAGWSCIVSSRLGDTEDSFISDFAVGLNAGQIKAGAPCRLERVSKYNQLLRIEAKLGPECIYAGNHFRRIHRKDIHINLI